MIVNLLRIFHAALIIRLLLQLANSQICDPTQVAAELAITLLRPILERRFSTTRTKVQILLSMTICYALFPNKMLPLSWLFCFKTIQLYDSIVGFYEIEYLTFTSLFYLTFMFVGFVSLVYRFYCHTAHAPASDHYIVIYQLMVTASTIGYGDYTPKTETQILFFTCMIPFLCASFVIHVNSLVTAYTSTFLSEDHKQEEQHKITN